MSTSTKTAKALGVSLHYFDANSGTSGRGSDKFYRLYLYQTRSGYAVTSHWGRDGAVGQSKSVEFAIWSEAKNYMVKLGDSKMRHGYEWLGEKEISLPSNVSANLPSMGEALIKATGRTPTKINGFALIIQEEADLIDLLMS